MSREFTLPVTGIAGIPLASHHFGERRAKRSRLCARGYKTRDLMMTRRLQTQAANPVPAGEPDFDGLVAMYEHEALRLMMRCLYRQFLNEENAAAVRTAATLLKSLPPARRGNEWIEVLDEIERDIARMTPEEMTPQP